MARQDVTSRLADGRRATSGRRSGGNTTGVKAELTNGQINGAKMEPASGMSAGGRTIRARMLASNSLTRYLLFLKAPGLAAH